MTSITISDPDLQYIRRMMTGISQYSVPFFTDKEWMAKLLEDAMSGDYQAYKELNELVLTKPSHAEYSDTVLALKDTYGYE